MTFNFDTYPANVLNTPVITSFTDEDEKFFTQNLTNCAFFGTKFDSEPKIVADSSSNPQYQAQVYYVYDTTANSTWKALFGFTWNSADLYFGIFEFSDSTKVNGIKVYRVSDSDIAEIKKNYIETIPDNPSENSIKFIKTGVFTKGEDSTPLFGYYYHLNVQVAEEKFYLPPRSFFLEGKHAPVTSPSFYGNLGVTKSKVLSYKNKEN